MNKLKSKLNIILLIFATIIVLFVSLKDNFYDVIVGLALINVFWIVIALIFVLGYYYFRSLSLYSFVKKFKSDITFAKIFRIVFITQFFDGITPSSSGGQPYQLYAFSKEKLELTDSTNIVIQNFIVYQIALVLLGFIAVVSNKYSKLFDNVGLKRLIMLGFIINVIVIVSLFSLAFFKKLNELIVKVMVKIFSKLKIIKNEDKIINNINEYVDKFHDGALILIKNKKNFIKTIFYNFIALLLMYAIPAILVFGIGDYRSINVYNSIIASAYVMLIGSFIPIPGATGGLEYAFMQFYGVFITSSTLTLIMLLWRALTYYLGVIIGAVFLNIRKRR